MSNLSPKLMRYRRAAQKAADWLESQQDGDGAIDPAGGIVAVYKTTFALVTAGRLHAAWRLLDYIKKHYMTEPGEFHATGEGPLDEFYGFYRNCYILKAAICSGRFDMACPAALKQVGRYQHRSGGFCWSLKPSGRRRIDSLFTSLGGWMCLYSAQTGRAVRAGDFLVALVQNQPDMPKRFFFHTDVRTGRCVTQFPPGTGVLYFVDRKGTRQHFYYTGAIMGFLADLYQATDDRKYLEAAETLFAFEQGMNPKGFPWPSKCKVGWGAACLYAATGKADHRKLAEKIADITLVKTQRSDGGWDGFEVPQREDGTGFFVPELDLTAEFTFELCEIVKTLGGHAAPRTPRSRRL